MSGDIVQRIYGLIPFGEENAVSASDLKSLAGIKSSRQLRFFIHQMRESGLLVCSGDRGYFRPQNAEQIRRFLHRMHAQARSMIRVTRGALMAIAGDSDV